MSRTCKVTVNNETFEAKCGDLLLDGAIANGVDLPHDCRSGVCGTCKVRVERGKVFGGHDGDSDMIYACRARVVSDVKVVVEPVPDTVSVSAEVANMVRLAPDIFGVDLKLQNKLRYLPGQYCKVQFRGFPARCYSPTYPLQGAPRDRLFHFHILGARSRNPRRASRQADRPLWQRLLQAKTPGSHRDRCQRHRLRADVVGRHRRDQATSAA
jgi:ferredoxin